MPQDIKHYSLVNYYDYITIDLSVRILICLAQNRNKLVVYATRVDEDYYMLVLAYKHHSCNSTRNILLLSAIEKL